MKPVIYESPDKGKTIYERDILSKERTLSKYMPKVLDIGSYYVSNFLKKDEDYTERKKYSLNLFLDNELGAIRLGKDDLAPPETMWGQYWYRSGTNATMTKELESIVAEVCSRIKLKSNDIWLDIACNDGTLLKNIPPNIKAIGIDPCDDTYYAESSKYAEVIQDYFTYDAWCRTSVAERKAKVITCIAMFYDLDNPHSFVQDLYKVLDDDGTLVLQMSYTPLMVKQMAFDNICHEHVYYYDLTSIQKLFTMHGFKIVDCNLNDTNGGSFRIYLQKEIAKSFSFGTAPLRDVCNMRVSSILNYEKNELNIRNIEVWNNFANNLNKLKTTVVQFVDGAIAKGKTVYGYGASTKGNTLLQYFNLDHTKIKAIAERSPYKFGMKTIGTNIPIVSEEEMRKSNPDYLLVLPWHFIDEFESREQDYINSGGTLVVPCPQFKIIKK
jgi:SAM-dependent methyltransferase